MAKKKTADRIVFRAGLNIGQLAAEDDDEFLRDAFVQLPIFAELTDLANPRSIILGRTGAGKTALLKHLKKTSKNVYDVIPKDVSLNYISNSNVIKFFTELGVDLDLFYQLLWRHVIAVELIRQKFEIKSEWDMNHFFDRLFKFILTDDRKHAAIEYLKKWQNRFWVNWDERIKEITQRFEEDLSASAEAAIPGLKFEAGAHAKLENTQRSELAQRAQSVVNAVQIAELSKVIDILAEEAFSEKDKPHYLLIDALDEKWVDESIRFKLIRALIETVKVFRRINTLKIVIALRADILERVYTETRDLGFQLDKYDGYMARLKWSEPKLRELVDKRIQALFRKRYTKQDVAFGDIFPSRVGQDETFKYMLDRTLMRPRDVIAFVNECLIAAEGRTEISVQVIRNAELRYSLRRLNAIQEEWQSVHPNLQIGIGLLVKKGARINFADISAKEIIEDVALKLYNSPVKSSDEIRSAAEAVFDHTSATNILRFAKLVTSILYKVGLVGIKFDKNQAYNFCYIDAPTVLEHQINEDSKLAVHPMFWRALNTGLPTAS